MSRPEATVSVYLGRLRRRSRLVRAVSALAASAGASAIVFALAAAVAGPVLSMSLAAGLWTAVLVTFGVTFVRTFRDPLGGVAGPRAAKLLSVISGELASASRSAMELATDKRALELAPDLVHAHVRQVADSVTAIPPRRVVPLSGVRTRPMFLGLVGICAAALLIVGLDRSALGAWALVHPGERESGGLRVAAAVSHVHARLVYPEYLKQPSTELEDVTHIEAPRGTSIRIMARTRVATTAALLELGETRIRLETDESGVLTGRFVVREDEELRFRLRDADGHWFRDASRRTVRVITDDPPRAAITEPDSDLTVELSEEVTVAWEADDDVALQSVDLVVRTPDGRELKNRLSEFVEVRQVAAEGSTKVIAATFGAQPGDRLTLWIEAADSDEFSGPKHTRSFPLILQIASDSTRREKLLTDLQRVVNLGLDALADRLELAVPEESEGAKDRFHTVKRSTDQFTSALRALAASDSTALADPTHTGVYLEISRRIRRAVERERRLHLGRMASLRRRLAENARVVEAMEGNVLLLADLIGRARLNDAATIARELEDLRRHISSLLEELRRADSEETRLELLAAIARATARMRELGERLAAMSRDVPSEFINTEAVPQREAQNSLAALQQAVLEGDLDAAERQLSSLESEIDAIARMLGGGFDAFTEARFGPRDRAMAEAMDSLAGLEAEQQQLARRTMDLRKAAAERALSESGGQSEAAARNLMPEVRNLKEAISGISPLSQDLESEVLERARQRMVDVEDALRTGDIGEARRMAEEASIELEEVARDLELSALMFPGAEGQTAEQASRARRAADALTELRRTIDEAIPDVSQFVGEHGRHQMGQDARRQHRAEVATAELEGRFAEGPDGSPLLPDAAEALGEARKTMEQARQGLERGAPIDASRAQQEAARRLTDLREELERQQQPQGGGGGGSDRRGGGSGSAFQQRVRIPGAEEFSGPTELRRRLLDAMRESTPPGYEDSVRRYYEELLR